MFVLYSVDHNRIWKSNHNIEADEVTEGQLKMYTIWSKARPDKIFLETAAVNLIGTFIRGWRRNDDGWKDESTEGKSAFLIRSQNAAAKLRSR